MISAAATVSGTLGLGVRCRLVTYTLGGSRWVTLGSTEADAPRPVVLTDTAMEAAWADYVLPLNCHHSFGYKLQLTLPAEGLPHLVQLNGGALEAIPDTTTPDDTALTPSELLWERTPSGRLDDDEDDDEDGQYILRSCAALTHAVLPPITSKSPLLHGDTQPPLVFATEYLCDCGYCWTTSRTGVCSYCRAQAQTALYMATHGGEPPMLPCDCCDTPTPYGGFCSSACKGDATGEWR